MKNLDRLSPRDLGLLSAYLDGEISNKEAGKLETRLRAEPGLRRALEELRATTALLRALPEVPPPHDFALTPEMVGVRRRRSYPVFRLATALASIAFVALIGLDAMTTALSPLAGSMAPADYTREQAADEEMMAEAPMMAAEPGALPTEGSGMEDEQDVAEVLQMTEEAAERNDGVFGESGAPPESTPTCCDKAIKSTGPWVSLEEPTPRVSELPADIEPVQEEVEPRRGLQAWPAWRIGLRIGELLFGAAALVLASFMFWTRRK